MRVIYLKKIGSYVLFPISDEEEESISEIAMVLRPGDRIYYRKHESTKTGQNVFRTWSRFRYGVIRIDFAFSGSTKQDNENIENIVGHAFLPNTDFYLRFIHGVKIGGSWTIIVCPKILKKKIIVNMCF